MRECCILVPGETSGSIVLKTDHDRTGNFRNLISFDSMDRLYAKLAERNEKFKAHYALVERFPEQEGLPGDRWANISIVLPFKTVLGALELCYNVTTMKQINMGDHKAYTTVPRPEYLTFGAGDLEDWQYLNQLS